MTASASALTADLRRIHRRRHGEAPEPARRLAGARAELAEGGAAVARAQRLRLYRGQQVLGTQLTLLPAPGDSL